MKQEETLLTAQWVRSEAEVKRRSKKEDSSVSLGSVVSPGGAGDCNSHQEAVSRENVQLASHSSDNMKLLLKS